MLACVDVCARLIPPFLIWRCVCGGGTIDQIAAASGLPAEGLAGATSDKAEEAMRNALRTSEEDQP
eukprot:3328901-Pyramimonas_sp.AAC.1